MDETTSYPPIEPSNFDLIVVGTGLPESIIASAASAAGKTVLHLDPNPFYGTHSASLPLNDFISFLQSQSGSQSQPPVQTSDGYASVPLVTRPLYSAVEINSYSSEPVDNSRKFNLDLAGPRVFLCADSMIDLILKTGINQYMEFKSVDASFVSDAEGRLENVPDSRSAIFKNRNLSLTEKNQLMKFFKLVQGHFGNGSEEDRISEEDLESPFVEFLTKIGLSKKLKSIVLYTIVLADYDQENSEVCKDVINTKSGINLLALYHSSIGRFPNANGAIIYPIYGQGELPQAFCRRAAVKGCIYLLINTTLDIPEFLWSVSCHGLKHGNLTQLKSLLNREYLATPMSFDQVVEVRIQMVLRMPVVAVLMDKDDGICKGVKLASGQELFSPQLIFAPSFTIPSTLAAAVQLANSHDVSLSDSKEKVARGICVAKKSLNPEVANCLVFFPPRSLYPEQKTSVRVLQLSGNVAVCPSGMFVTYLSAMCDNAIEGKKLINAAINALFSMPVSGESENNGIDNFHELTEEKPCLLWSILYIQEMTKFDRSFDSISFTTMPDEHLHYLDLLDQTEKLFKEIYPNEEFFKITSESDEHLDDGPELDP